MPIAPIEISVFVEASRRYAQKSAKKADQDGDGKLSAKEAEKLPKDLRDNFKNTGRNSVKADTFVDNFVKYVALHAKRADANRDGKLTQTDARRLPADLRDNFRNYSARVGGLPPVTEVRDRTPATLISKHLATYGVTPTGYQEAFKRGIEAVLTQEDGETPRAILKEFADPPMTKAQLDAAMKGIFKSMKLLPLGEAGETSFDARTQWVFSVEADAGSDHGFWVAVDRQTGVALVEGFN